MDDCIVIDLGFPNSWDHVLMRDQTHRTGRNARVSSLRARRVDARDRLQLCATYETPEFMSQMVKCCIVLACNADHMMLGGHTVLTSTLSASVAWREGVDRAPVAVGTVASPWLGSIKH